MSGEWGGNYPARLFSAVLQKAHQDYKVAPQKMPAGVSKITVCSVSGKRPSSKCPEQVIVSDYCSKQFIPEETCDQLHEIIYICTESGKLPGKYCPNPQPLYPFHLTAWRNRPEVPTEKLIFMFITTNRLTSNKYNTSLWWGVHLHRPPQRRGNTPGYIL